MLKHTFKASLLSAACLCTSQLLAQTDIDAVMMAKKNLCAGLTYNYASWDHYWEGTFYRNNANLGTVSTKGYDAMLAYGITDNLNVLVNVPYVSTKATAGTLHGMKGFQDLSAFGKYRFVNQEKGKLRLSAYGVGGFSTPMSNYSADFLPMSIGMKSTNAIARLIADVQYQHWYITVSGNYIWRSNVKLDAPSYYTTEIHNTNMVDMPNVNGFNVRLGYRTDEMYIEAVLDRMNTIGGFDIRKNIMPFPSNNMDATRAGINFKIPIPKVSGLQVVGASMYTLAGRNVGKSWMNMGGLFYVMSFDKKGDKK